MANEFVARNGIITNGKIGIGLTGPSESLETIGYVKASSGFKLNTGTDSKVLLDGGGSKLLTDFVYTDTKDTTGVSDTSFKIFLVGSTIQSTIPQVTYTQDTAYVSTDGCLYSGGSKTISVSDLVTNKIYPPILTSTWSVLKDDNSSSGQTFNGNDIILEYGLKPSASVVGKWVIQSGYDDPTSCSGLCGTTLPANNVNTSPVSTNTSLYNISITTPTKYSSTWNLFVDKKGITISGNSLILPTGSISSSTGLSVTYQMYIYQGYCTDNIINSSTIVGILSGLTSTWKNCQTSSKSSSPNINASDSQYWIYLYPSDWSTLTNISNADGDWTAAFNNGTISIARTETSLTTIYRYYITVNKGAFKNKIINFS